MIKLVDPSSEEFNLKDSNVRTLAASNGNTLEVAYVRFAPMPLLKVLKSFQNYFELIVFTVLPRRFVDLILKEISGIESYFSLILCQEEAQWTEDYILRDVSLFLGNRELLDVFVVEPHVEHVDGESVTSMNPEPYDGGKEYK